MPNLDSQIDAVKILLNQCKDVLSREDYHSLLIEIEDEADLRWRRETNTDYPLGASGQCRYCGCTDDEGCDEGCTWITPDHNVCSAKPCAAAHALASASKTA